VVLPTVDEIMKVLAELLGRQPRRFTFNNFLHLKEHCFPIGVRMFPSRKFYLIIE